MRGMVGKVFAVLEVAPQYEYARWVDELGLMALPSSNGIQGGQWYFPKAALVLAGTPPPPHSALPEAADSVVATDACCSHRHPPGL